MKILNHFIIIGFVQTNRTHMKKKHISKPPLTEIIKWSGNQIIMEGNKCFILKEYEL